MLRKFSEEPRKIRAAFYNDRRDDVAAVIKNTEERRARPPFYNPRHIVGAVAPTMRRG